MLGYQEELRQMVSGKQQKLDQLGYRDYLAQQGQA
jgi:hypothetical protein